MLSQNLLEFGPEKQPWEWAEPPGAQRGSRGRGAAGVTGSRSHGWEPAESPARDRWGSGPRGAWGAGCGAEGRPWA